MYSIQQPSAFTNKLTIQIILLIVNLSMLSACATQAPNIIIITATVPDQPVIAVQASSQAPSVAAPPIAATPVPQQTIVLSPMPQNALSYPTPNTEQAIAAIPAVHTVQSGDTLSGIANQYGLTVESILAANELLNPDILSIGQVITLPDVPQQQTPAFKIIPDSRLVRSPTSATFDVATFIDKQPGYIRIATDEVAIRVESGAGLPRTETAAQIVERVAREYSVDPRLLLIMLEYRAGWLSNPRPNDVLLVRPLVNAASAPRAEGLYRQLSWLANELNRGYYAWKYRGLSILSLADGQRLLFNPQLNPGTIALQYVLSLNDRPATAWQTDVAVKGFYATYAQYFGDPFQNPIEPLIPTNIQQPPLELPFENGVQWLYTGGPHGGWDTGSAWAALDFAPDEDRPEGRFCYTATSWLTAVAPGIIARADEGIVVLDLDGDGDETTGWTIMYLHLARDGMVAAGTRVNVGDRIAHPSCAGGFSNATHVHISRRYNGEWLPADCQACLPSYVVPPFTMEGWVTVGIAGQYYQGFMQNGERQIQAEQGLNTTINIITG